MSGSREYETVAVKRRLWHDLLRTALGEVVEGETVANDASGDSLRETSECSHERTLIDATRGE